MKKTKFSINTPTKQKNLNRVGVLFGGRSTEHEISLRSALFVLKNIPQKYTIIPIGISKEGVFRSLTGTFHAKDFNEYTINDLQTIVAGKVPKNTFKSQNKLSMFYPIPFRASNIEIETKLRNLNHDLDCVFPVLHGTNGEDGRLQGLFELAEIPCVGCNSVASVIGIDKDLQKRLVRDAGIPTTKYIAFNFAEYQTDAKTIFHKVESLIKFPCCIKPNSLGSTIGVNKANNLSELEQAVKEAFNYDSKVLAEAWIQGTEIECSFIGETHNPKISTPGEIATSNFYSYDEKYSETSKASLFVPARLTENRVLELQKIAKKIVYALNLKGFARLDFWNTSNNSFLFNEVNTIPGLTSISMFPKLLEYDGILAQKWLEELIESSFQYK